ncbi:MAG: prepilin-type N-terminal cleavage/methylation domain-containing protein [Verrucomicrobiae bacterium]|nr:prepilin-type N-terminal cleavage/methylation domain-containing protein [Verrucomicrobiae bacterium]
MNLRSFCAKHRCFRFRLYQGFLSGFTLLELIVCVAILSILASFLLQSVSRVRELARSVECVNNLRQLHMAVQSYVNDNEGWFPLANANRPGGATAVGSPWYSTRVIAQYVGHTRLDSEKGPAQCPSDKQVWTKVYPLTKGISCAMSEYLGCEFRIPVNYGYRRADSLKSPAATCMFIDSDRYNIATASPDYAWTFRHQNSANVVYCDGHCGKVEKSQIPTNEYDLFWDKP